MEVFVCFLIYFGVVLGGNFMDFKLKNFIFFVWWEGFILEFLVNWVGREMVIILEIYQVSFFDSLVDFNILVGNFDNFGFVKMGNNSICFMGCCGDIRR